MSISSVLVALLVYSAVVSSQPTCLLVNEGVLYEPYNPDVEIYDSVEPHCKAPICHGEVMFIEVISQGHIIFDKSLLIRAVLSTPQKTILFSFPRKWCKTINLHMIKMFLEIEVHNNGTRITPEIETNNFRLFKHGKLGKRVKLQNPLQISVHNDLFLKYFGKYPVVYAYLDMYGITRLSGFHEVLKIFISYTFRRHDYMLDVFEAIKNSTDATPLEKINADSQYQTFVMYMIRESSGDDLYQCLYFLSEVLYKHYKQKVFMIIDEYDDVINYLIFEYFNPDKYEIIEFYMKFLKHSIVDNPYIEKTILGGTLTLERCIGTDAFKTNFIESPFNPYFGFHDREMNSLYEYLNISQTERKILREWANGYQVNFTSPHKIYEARLVNIFLQYRDYTHFPQAVTGNVEVYVPLFIRIPGYQEASAILLRGGTYTIHLQAVEYSYEKLRYLADCFDHPKPVVHDYPAVDAALHYLLVKGHLTWVHHSVTPNGTIVLSVKIPNKETLDRLKERFLFEYAEHRFFIEALDHLPKYLQNATNAFQRYFQSEAESDDEFVALCQHAITHIRTTDDIVDKVVEDGEQIVDIFRKPFYISPAIMVRSFLYAMVSYTGNFPIHSTKFLRDDPHKPDIIFTHVHHGVLVKVVGPSNSTNSSTPVTQAPVLPRLFTNNSGDIFKKLPKFSEIRRVKFVEFHLTSGTTFIMRGWSKEIPR